MSAPAGGLVTILILLPNLLWMLLPPREESKGPAPTEVGLWRVLTGVEWVSRIAAMVIPFFYPIEVQNTWQAVALAIAGLALLVYYAGWARYFARGRRQALLFEPLLGLPVPLAISPLVCWGAAAVLFGSWPLALATAALAGTHIPISLREWRGQRMERVER